MLHSLTPLFVRKITGKLWQKTQQRSIAPNLVLTLHHIIMTLEVNQPIWKIFVATLCNQFWRVCHFVLVSVLANRLCYSLCFILHPLRKYIYTLCNFFFSPRWFTVFLDVVHQWGWKDIEIIFVYLQKAMIHVDPVVLLSLSIRVTIDLLRFGE